MRESRSIRTHFLRSFAFALDENWDAAMSRWVVHTRVKFWRYMVDVHGENFAWVIFIIMEHVSDRPASGHF